MLRNERPEVVGCFADVRDEADERAGAVPVAVDLELDVRLLADRSPTALKRP